MEVLILGSLAYRSRKPKTKKICETFPKEGGGLQKKKSQSQFEIFGNPGSGGSQIFKKPEL